jgi:hypothetical protein
MKIYVYPADITGCGHFRLIWPVEALKKQGYDIELCLPGERDHFMGKIENDKIVDVTIPSDADVIVLQRITHKYLAQAVEMIRSRGVAVIIDIDDDLARIHPSNPAWAMLHPKSSGGLGIDDHSWHHVELACRTSTLTVVSSDALATRYAGVNGARVISNYVPDHYLGIPHTDSDVIGWGGSVATHPDDLQEASTGVARLVNNGVAEFLLVGPGEGGEKTLGITQGFTATGSVPHDEWPQQFSRIGIGIAPLADTQFNRAKSFLKPLEMAALGIPCVVSPRAEYVKLHEQTGIGVVAHRPKDWYRELRRFVEDAPYRRLKGVLAREAAGKLTYSQHAWRWMEVWEEAARLR